MICWKILKIIRNVEQILENIEKPSKMIFVYSVGGIIVVFVIAKLIGFSYVENNDIFNWVSLVIEIGAASGITVFVWKYTKFEQSKTNQIIEDVKNLTAKINLIIKKEHEAKQSQEFYALNYLTAYLTKLSVHFKLINFNLEHPQERGFWIENMIKEISQKEETVERLEKNLNLSVGIINQNWVNEIQEILDVSKECVYFKNRNEKHIDPKECTFLAKRIDDLLSIMDKPTNSNDSQRSEKSL